MVDTAGSPRRQLFDIQRSWYQPLDLSWSPDGQRIAFVFEGEIWTVRIQDRSVRQLTFENRFPRFPAWDTDSRHLFYTRTRHADEPDSLGGLRVLDTVDGSERAFLHDSGLATWNGTPPSISPDGQRLTFSMVLTEGTGWDRKSFREVYVVNRDGSNYRRITWLRGYAFYPQWWADGRHIFFDRAPYECGPQHGGRTTWVISEDGTGLQEWGVNLGDPDVQFGFPFVLTPDGRRVAFVGKNPTATMGVLWVMNLDGTGRRQLTAF